MKVPTYLLHGLRVRSEISLAERLANGARPDVDVRWGELTPIPAGPPAGRVLAFGAPGVVGSMIVESESGVTIRLPAECEFRISRDRHAIDIDVAPGFEKGLARILLTGNVLAALLNLQGACVLHASAVCNDGWTLGILGVSGQGKSTLAALCCSAGAQLVSDDLIRVDSDGGCPRCYSGTAQIRLRPKAAEIADLFPLDPRESTSDGRIAITPAQATGPTFNLDALLVPLPSRRARQLRVRRLPKMEALVSLLGYPRVLGWDATEPIRCHFEVCAELAETVPVFEAKIPWVPPFTPQLAQILLEKLQT